MKLQALDLEELKHFMALISFYAEATSRDKGVLRPATLLRKRLWHMCFPVNFGKFLRTLISQNTPGRLTS